MYSLLANFYNKMISLPKEKSLITDEIQSY